MAIVKMNKFTLLAFESKKDELLKKLQAFSNAEFINLQDENILENNEIFKELNKDKADSDLAKWEEQLSKVKYVMQFLENYVPKQSLIKSLREEKIALTMSELEMKVLASDWEEIYKKVKEKENELAKLQNEKTRLQGSVDSLKPYETFNAPLSYLKELNLTSYFLGSVSNQYEENLIMYLNDCYVEIVSQNNQETYFLAITNKEYTKKVEEILKGYGFSSFKFDEEDVPLKLIHDYNERISLIESDKFIIREELSGYDEEMKTIQLAYEYYNNLVFRKTISSNFLKTERTILIQGWVPVKLNEKLSEIVKDISGDEYYINFEEVKEEEIDDVPVQLENNDLNASFEDVTAMYSLPKYNYIDPTPLLTPFYLIFFGMMVADAGYGLIMLIGTLISLKYFNFEASTKKMIKFFMYLSFPTIAFGLMYGSVFGNILPIVGLIDTNRDVMTILAMSLVFGVIQIFFGLGIKAYILIKMGKPLEAFMDSGSWIITLVSLGGLGASSMFNIPVLKTISIVGIIIGALLIIFTQGRNVESKGGKIGQGLYELYGITSYVGDLVSYTRLMAIGLSGGSIAGAINMIMKMVPGPIGVFIMGPLIFIIFQTVNLLLSLLGGYVHSLRLTYVEYFSKFYEGGGRPFKPFEAKNKYINLKKD